MKKPASRQRLFIRQHFAIRLLFRGQLPMCVAASCELAGPHAGSRWPRTIQTGSVVGFAMLAALLGGCANEPRGRAGASGAPTEVQETEPLATKDAVQLEELDGGVCDPLAASHRALAFVFVRTDCPIANRYAPELRRIVEAYAEHVELILICPDRDETAESIRAHLRDYGYTCRALLDPHLEFARAVGARVTPEAAVFDRERRLVYCGRIDNRFADFGQSRPSANSHDLTDVLDALAAGEPIEFTRTKAVGCFIADLQ